MRAAIVVACVLCASTASAQGIGREWLEKMSGPDLGGGEVRVPVACIWQKPSLDEKIKVHDWVWYFETSNTRDLGRRKGKATINQRLYCFDVAFAAFTNGDRAEQAFHVSGQRYEAAFTWRLERLHDSLRFIEPGIAVGAIGFLTDTRRQWRPDVSIRIAIRPLDLIPSLRLNGWGSVIQVSLRPEFILGGISNEDLGDPTEVYDHTFRWGGSWRHRPWVIVDLSEKLGLR